MGRDTVQLETVVSTIFEEYLLEFTSEYGISEALRPELPGPGERIVDFPEGKNNRFFLVDERVFPIIVDWRTSAPKDEMPAENTYSPEAVMILNTHRTPIQKQPEALLCLVGSSHRYFLVDEVYPTFLHDDDRDMDLFNLIRAPNPTKVKTGTCPRAAYKVPILTVTASRVIEMEDPAAEKDSSRVPSTIERSPLDFANENPSQQSTEPEDQGQEAVAPEVPPPENVTATGVAPEACQAEGIAATGPHVIKERRKRGNDGSTHKGKSLVAMALGMGSTHPVPASRGAPVDVSDPDPLSFVDPQSRPTADVTHIYRPEWCVTNGYILNAPEVCQDLVDHIAPPGYISELRHLHNDDFLKQYNVNLAWQVAMGSQLRLRFEQEAKLLKKFVAQVTRRDKRIQARENKIKNLKTLLEAETDMKKTAEGKIAELSKELENLRALWVIGHGLCLAVMKCGESTELRQVFADVVSAGIAKGMSEGLKYEVEHGKANLSLEAIEAYDPEAEAKYITALHALKDLKYPIVDQLESLKDAPMDVIMESLHLESDTGDDALQWIRELRPSSSQLKIPVYPEARDPTDPWACKEEILLVDAIAANVSCAEKKKKCRVSYVPADSNSFVSTDASEEEGLDGGYDKMQKILSKMNTLKIKPDQEDINMKFLRGLPPSWANIAQIIKVKGGLEYMSLDDLYNKLKCLEIDNKGYSIPASALANATFVSFSSSSRSKLSYQEINGGGSSAKHSASKGSSTFDEYEIKHQIAMIAIKARKFEKRSQVSQESTNYKNYKKKEAAKEASESSALVVIDGSQGVNWDKQLQENTTEPGVLGNYRFFAEKGTNSTVPADDAVPASAFISAEPTILADRVIAAEASVLAVDGILADSEFAMMSLPSKNTTEPGVLGNYGFVAEKRTNSTVPADDVVPADAVPASSFISAEPT
nr:transposase (putative), gypsy type [Tanacetum cinerariifolium]